MVKCVNITFLDKVDYDPNSADLNLEFSYFYYSPMWNNISA